MGTQHYGRNSRLKLAQPIAFLVTSALLCSLAACACAAASVIVDVPGQSVKCDDDKLETRYMKPKGEQIGAFIQNTTLEPRELVAKVTGLKDQKYDVYINTEYLGARNAQELESGLQLTASGSVADPDMMLCLNTVQPMIDSEYLRLRLIRDPEPARVCATLQQAIDWVRSAIKTEKFHRSVAIVITPEGRMLEKAPTPTRLEALETAAAVTRACWLLQHARATMASVIIDPDLRDSAVLAMTPVDLTTSFVVKNGKPHVDAVVTNCCNLPITGKITAAIPKGWKWNAKNTTFADLKSGKAFKLSFDLSRKTPGAAVPNGVRMAATIKLVQDPFEAQYRIRTIARTPTPESAVMPKPTAKPPSVAPPPDIVKPPEIKP